MCCTSMRDPPHAHPDRRAIFEPVGDCQEATRSMQHPGLRRKILPIPGYNGAYSHGLTGACLSTIAITAARTLVLLVILAAPASLLAQSAPVGDWEPTGLAAPAYRLHTPASGALYASAQPGLMRSDDGGAGWRPAGLPPDAWNVTVDPVDQDILYAATQ